MAQLDDRTFVALARRVGYPPESELRRVRTIQLERQRAWNRPVSLYETACAEGLLTADQMRRYERWTDQIARRDAAPLEEGTEASDVGTPPASAPAAPAPAPLTDSVALTGRRQKRVISKSAADFWALTPSCDRCNKDLDELALMEGRAREVEGKRVCNACYPVPVAGGPATASPQAPPSAPPPPQPLPLGAPIPTVTAKKRGRVRNLLSSSAELILRPIRGRRPAAPPTASPDAPVVPDAAPAPGSPRRRRVRDVLNSSAELIVRPIRRRLRPLEPPPPPADRATIAVVVVSILLLVAVLAVAVVLLFRKRGSTRADDGLPATGAGVGAPVRPKDPGRAFPDLDLEAPLPPPASPAEDAARAVGLAERLEREGREIESCAALDSALARTSDPGAASLLTNARDDLFARCRERIEEEARELVRLLIDGRADEAREHLARLRAHVPPAQRRDLEAAVRRVNETVAGHWQRTNGGASAPPRPATDAPGGGEAPVTPGVGGPGPSARYLAARERVDRALAALDTASAHVALDEVEGSLEASDRPELALDRRRVAAVVKLVDLARAGIKSQVGRELELPLRKAPRVSGKLVSFEKDRLEVEVAAGAQRGVLLAELAPETVFLAAKRSSRADPTEYWLGRGVVLACAGDRKGALEALSHARAVPEAALLEKRLAAGAPPETEVAHGTKAPVPAPGPGPKPVAPPTLEPADAPRPPTWMDDVSGSVAWDQAYVLESDHYKIKTGIKRAYAERYRDLMEALADRYAVVFSFAGNDFKYKKNELHLYSNWQEYLDHEKKPDALGFYEPWSKRIVTFHGPCEFNGANGTTLNILAHEATHQFQNLVLRQMDHAPVFFIEGLASFFEASEIRENGDVLVGKIPLDRLRAMQRSIRAKDSIPLKTVIRTPREGFTWTYYTHAWALLHWCFYGPEQRKAAKLLDRYWELCLQRPTKAEEFEEGVAAMGMTMDRLEQSVKDWMLSLDPKKDPAVLLYEKHRKSKKR